jgi:PAS domain S-box-containing protein
MRATQCRDFPDRFEIPGVRLLSIHEYKAVFDAAPDGVVVVDSGGVIRAVNPKVEQMFGWVADDLEGEPIEVLIPEEVRGAHQKHRTAFVRNPHDRPMGVGLELYGRRKDGSRFPIEVSLSPWRRDGDGLRVICSVRDISAIRRLQNFSEGALRATEEERRRIARELHDDTAQRLAVLILRLRQLAGERDTERRNELFEVIREEVVETSDGVKRMARGLRPPELEELGLEHALQAHARNLRESGVFDVDIVNTVGIEDCLDETEKLVVYRIVQEAIWNAVRYSGEASASVRIWRERETVVAEVSDGGRGFDPNLVADAEAGLGLIGMQERATMIGGRLDIDSLPGEGTRVRVIVPVHVDSENDCD